MNILIWLAVAGGGALGAMARYGVSRASTHYLGVNFPWGTFIANILGSMIMGALIVALSRTEPHSQELRAFLTVGVLGAFTTFSTFSLDVITLYENRSLAIAGLYLGGSVLFSLIGLFLGMALARNIG